jgi:hypothetical protein
MIYKEVSTSTVRCAMDSVCDVYFKDVQTPLSLFKLSRELHDDVASFREVNRLAHPVVLYSKPIPERLTGSYSTLCKLTDLVALLQLGRKYDLIHLSRFPPGSTVPNEPSKWSLKMALTRYLQTEKMRRGDRRDVSKAATERIEEFYTTTLLRLRRNPAVKIYLLTGDFRGISMGNFRGTVQQTAEDTKTWETFRDETNGKVGRKQWEPLKIS